MSSLFSIQNLNHNNDIKEGRYSNMKLGFLTGCLQESTLIEKINWAKANGFDCVEVSCWPKINTRNYSGSDIDVKNLDEKGVKAIKEMLKKNNLFISSLAYYDNNLHRDIDVRRKNIEHLKKVIDAAQMLEVELVGTFVGRNSDMTIEENFDLYEEVFTELVEYSKDRNVKLMIENCPMPEWQMDGGAGTISYSPELWNEMFERIPDENFGLNFDPSHLTWLQIDYIKAFIDYKDRIFHVHAKDIEFSKEMLSHYSIFGKQLNKKTPMDLGWWKAKIPGKGQIDWDKFINTLKENNYKGVVSIEHEDEDYANDEGIIKEGLVYSNKHLRKFMD